MTFRKIVRTFALTSLLTLTSHSANAQDLLARQAPIDRRAKALDTMVITRLREAEEIEEPASELYNDWNNNYAHRGGNLPDVYKIDLRGFHMPTPSRVITSNFGRRWGRRHQGLDIKVYIGDTIRAAFSGKVRVVKYDANGYGKYIVIRHNNGLETIYGHLSKQIVSPNQTVRAGQPIGLGGNTGRSTGSHLHFETRLAGVALNPALFFDFAHQDVTGDYYVFRRSTVAQESDRATAARGTSSSLGYSRENIQGRSNRSYSQRQEKTYNTDFSSHTPRTEAAAEGSQITYHKVVNGETLETIARQHGISLEQLCRQNHLGKFTKVVGGQLLAIGK
ncbi:peptidoglycan DD-metalloendopeptidase family protein [Prevotella multiformis]|uniref:M23 family metallopeptidase n=1 Tax=Prevotella multiformis TaxID=282402 RepID=UPI001BA9A0FD|nr:M23 family metallopeptidase [Prevotella multiformis]QUB70338.1 peptidoglycan DD-metalloendopeptidase family protein [Prevotella multiformis]